MPVYCSAIVPGASGNDANVNSAASSVIQVFSVREGFVSSGTPTAVSNSSLGNVASGGTVTGQGIEKANTRSATSGSTAQSSTAATEGTSYAQIHAGENQDEYGSWQAPRPWAAYSKINGETLGIITAAIVGAYRFAWSEGQTFTPTVLRPRRRGTRRGLWHWNAPCNNLRGVLSQPAATPFAQHWVAYTRINPEWRQFNNTPVQLGSLPTNIQTPHLAVQRFPMPEVYQRLATVSSNFGQISFPLLGSWQPGTMDPPFVRAQWLLQEITPVPIPVGPSPALIPLPQQAATIPPISSAFYQQHPNPVTAAPAPVGGLSGMTWYWP